MYTVRPEIRLEIEIWPPRIICRRGVWHAFGRTSRRLKYLPFPLKSDVLLGRATTFDGARNLGRGWDERVAKADQEAA
jgi:hypothetical protein